MGVHEILIELETLRKKIRMRQLIPLALLLVIIVVIMVGASGLGIPCFIAIIVCMILMSGKTNKYINRHKELYKETFVNSLLKTMLDDVYYDWRAGFSEMDVMGFGIVKMGNRYHSEDYLKGSYNGVKFRQADVTIRHETGSGDDKQVTTYFSGRMFEFSFDGKSVRNVKVFSKIYNSWLNLASDKVEMENVAFNNQFKVYSLDPLDAFYVLTPHMMERIKRLQTQYPNIGFRFGENKLCVGINGGDSFDNDYTKPINYPEEQARMKKDIQVIIDIIEMIGLIQEEN